jgi:hypothetical protein
VSERQESPPQFSTDGKRWWNGRQWVPANQAPLLQRWPTSITPTPAIVEGEPVLITIGNIACTKSQVITPSGNYPLAGTVWMVSNNTMTTSSVSTLGVVLCILFIWVCLLGLLFLLLKEERTQGFVQVSVQGDGLYHAVQIPVTSPFAAGQIEQQVNYVRSLVATLPSSRNL